MATDAQGAKPPSSPRKKSFYVEEEDIIVKPSTELIPDEYEHKTNVLFHVFRIFPDKLLAEDLIQALQSIQYNVSNEENVHDLDTAKTFQTDIENIKKETVDKGALVVVVMGYFDKNRSGALFFGNEDEENNTVEIKSVLNAFSARNCPQLKHKPKIFMFCVSGFPPKIQSDSIRHRAVKYDKVYDFPNESDMLVIYHRVPDAFSSSKEAFLSRFCQNIRDYSQKHDIIDLVSYIDHSSKTVPLIISTLTRKFYFTDSSQREHQLSAMQNHSHLQGVIERMQSDIQKLHEAQKKKNGKMFGFSFRKKGEEKPKVTKREPETFKTPPPVSDDSSKRLSSGSVTGRRQRNVSESDSAKNKPRWRF